MILIIAVLAILLLIACVGLHVLNEGVKEAHVVAEDYEQRWFDESKESSKLRNDKHHEWERAEVLQEQVFALELTIADLQAELSERSIPAQAEEEPTIGSFVQTRTLKRANPETYRNVFDLDINGKRVIDHLERTFASTNSYVRGGHDAERESCFKAGQASVIGFIFKQINTANSPNYNPENYEEQVND